MANASIHSLTSAQVLVTYIIPAFNAAEFVKGCLRGFMGQSYRPIEVVLVDDGSTDDTASQALEMRDCLASSRISFTLVRQINGGTSSARNAGLAVANGAILGFVDVDDLLPPLRTEALVSALTRSGADLAYGKTVRFSNEAPDWGKQEPDPEFSTVEVGDHLVKCVPGQTQFLARRSLVAEIGGFDPRLRMADEFEYIVRLRVIHPKMVCCKQVVYGYRKHWGSNTTLGPMRRLPFMLMSHESMLAQLLRSAPSERKSVVALRRMFSRDLKQAIVYAGSDEVRRMQGLSALAPEPGRWVIAFCSFLLLQCRLLRPVAALARTISGAR